MRNTARVIHDLPDDVLAAVEAENRPVFEQFTQQVLSAVGGQTIRHTMVIDGRGIDVRLVTGKNHPIGLMVSHVGDRDRRSNDICSSDCPELRSLVA